MIADAFMFMDEAECLAIRLRELQDVVDRVVIVEAKETFQGQPRALVFPTLRDIWGPHKDRITYLAVDRFRGCTRTWDREAAQRNLMAAGTENLPGDTVVLMSDADEIPRASAVRAYTTGMDQHGIIRFGGPHFHYYLNVRQVTYPVWYGTHAVHNFTLQKRTPQQVRGTSMGHTYSPGSVQSAGWHFGFLGSTDRSIGKLHAWSHDEDSHYGNQTNMYDAVTSLTDWKRDRGMQMRVIPIDDTWPLYVRENPDKVKEWIRIVP